MATRLREVMLRLKRQFSYGCTSNRNDSINWDLDSSFVKLYVENSPKILDKIILNLRSTNQLKMLLQQKQSQNFANLAFVSEPEDDVNAKFNILSIKDQTEEYLKETREPDLGKIFYDAAEVIAKVLHVDWFSVYLPKQNKRILVEYEAGGREKLYGPIGLEMTVSAAAASVCRTLVIDNLQQNGKYPNGVGHPERNIHNVLSIPLVFPSGDLQGVIELCNTGLKDPFGIEDLDTSNALLGWMVSSLHEAKINSVFVIQSRLNEFLMNTSKELFDGKISTENLAENILTFSKDLVHADRCSMFLINEDKNQLYADYFDEGHRDGNPVCPPTPEVQFPCEKGIAGYVYTTGEIVNVDNAYADERFNPAIDKQTGYVTRNILCVPLLSNSCVVGVVQMINSLSDDHFTHADEYALKTYAVYCAMALHYSNLYNLLQHFEAKNKIVMEVLQFHIVAPEQDCQRLIEDTPPEIIPSSFSNYQFDPCSHKENLPQLFIYMMHDLFGKYSFDFNKLRQFVLTVKKNYRPLPYHNWVHVFKVTHTLYLMLKQNEHAFSNKERMALIIAGICHDLDHRGFNTLYYKELCLPLAQYCKVMEQHHYNQTCTILELDGHNILSFLSSSDYDLVLQMIHDLIIATDIARYFNNQQNVSQMMATGSFDIRKKECAELCKNLMMEAADISDFALPWNIHKEVVAHIYEEFYMQGDEEKANGLLPPEMMDRDYKDVIPEHEIRCIQFTYLPLFSTLVSIFPKCKPLLDETEKNLVCWKKVVAKRKKIRQRNQSISDD